MDKFYDFKFLLDTIWLAKSELDELSKWSVYNGDIDLDEIAELKQRFSDLADKLVTDAEKIVQESNKEKEQDEPLI